MPVVGSRQPEGELIRLQEELFDEVQKDSSAIAPHIFGDVDNQPDLGSVPNSRLDAIYREAYQKNDREFLQREARRDPQQFLKVAERLGVSQGPPNTVVQPNALAQAVAQQQQQPPPAPPMLPPGGALIQPASPAALAAPQASVAPTVPPVILGPNGQPLPPGFA